MPITLPGASAVLHTGWGAGSRAGHGARRRAGAPSTACRTVAAGGGALLHLEPALDGPYLASLDLPMVIKSPPELRTALHAHAQVLAAVAQRV